MPAIINTNIASLNAQRNLTKSQDALQISLQRLSSGLRINTAKDDAAGLAITERMTSQIRGLNQAARNASDGISLAQTAEGALSEVGANLQRIRELAVQSANSTNSVSDRASLNAEVQQLLSEIQRVSTTAQFNGQNILDGTFTASQFQVGANANQIITAGTGNAQTSALGSFKTESNTVTAVSGTALTAGSLTINGTDVGSSASGSAESIATAINGIYNQTNVIATATTTVTSSATNPLRRNQALQSGDLVINGIAIGATAGSSNVATQGANVAAAINAVTAQTGVTAVANGSSGALTLTSITGKTIDLTTNAATTADGATRVENATGLEMAGATKAFGINTLTFAGGVAQVVTNTSTTSANSTDTLTVAGVTFTYSSAASSATNILIANGTPTAQGSAVFAALNANATVTSQFTVVNTGGGVVTLTSKSNVLSTAYSDGLASASATSNASAWGQTTAGAGLAIGDTVKVGGLTYEFTRATATGVSVAGNIQVKLGASASTGAADAASATNFANALSAQQALGNGTVGLTTNSGVGVITVTNTLYGSTGVVAAPTEPVTSGTAGALILANPTAGTSGVYSASSTKGTLSLNSPSSYNIGGASPGTAGLGSANVSLATISAVDITSVAGANSAIVLLDGALSQVSSIRGSMGALQNRFSSVVSSLTASSENLSAARSRIQDTDFAVETAQLTRNQILQQAGTAMLAQANQLPNTVLTLLR